MTTITTEQFCGSSVNARVLDWEYKVDVAGFRSHRLLFAFRGTATQGRELEGLEVSGTIEMPHGIEFPQSDEPCPDHQGSFQIWEYNGSMQISVSLLVSRAAFDELFRVFAATSKGCEGLGLEISLRKASQEDLDEWRKHEVSEYLRISHFRFGTRIAIAGL